MSAATLPTPTPATSAVMTADEFLARYGDERGVELVRGTLRRKPMPGARHGFVCQRVAYRIARFLEERDLGYLLTNDTLIRTEQLPATFRGPDIQFFTYDRMPKGKLPVGVPDTAPELVFEVRSPSNTWGELRKKALEYLDAEVKVVVLIDPEDETATVYRADAKEMTLGSDGKLAVPEILPGFEMPMKSIFE